MWSRNAKTLFPSIRSLLAFSFCGFSFLFVNKFKHSPLQCSRGKIILDSDIPKYYEEVDKNALMQKYPNLTILTTNSIDMLIGRIRDIHVKSQEFRFLGRRLIRLLVEEALAGECDTIKINQSPLGYYKTIHNPRSEVDYVGVSILRSGNTMMEILVDIVPEIKVGSILLQRDESRDDKKPIFFFEKLPKDIENKRILLLDPMLGTGGSCSAAVEILKKKGVKEENIIFVNIISCVEGIDYITKLYPKMKIFTAKVDKDLLPNKYIAPGLGDFGDRFFGTED